jgi:hypothetical protein
MLLESGVGDAVLCTHGELIGQLLGRLRRAGSPIATDATWPKGSTWVLDPSADQITGNLPAAAAPRPRTSRPSTLNADYAPLPRPLTITLCRDPMATTTRTTSSSPEQ